jgi:hypothetical protein
LVEGVVAVVPDVGFSGRAGRGFADEAACSIVVVAGAAVTNEKVVAVLTVSGRSEIPFLQGGEEVKV